ncbi:MAG: PQQ-dependent sugar dehydrogenase, partial [Saprospiraceae bacterium]
MMRFLGTFLIIAIVNTCFGQKDDTTINTPATLNYTTELVVPELDIPWGMTFLPDGSMLVTEIKGKLIHFK